MFLAHVKWAVCLIQMAHWVQLRGQMLLTLEPVMCMSYSVWDQNHNSLVNQNRTVLICNGFAA